LLVTVAVDVSASPRPAAGRCATISGKTIGEIVSSSLTSKLPGTGHLAHAGYCAQWWRATAFALTLAYYPAIAYQ
jgi:hypothetical protein